MKKRSRKLISILLTLSLLVTLLVPMATPAAAGNGTISAMTTPTVADATAQTIGTIKVVVPAGSITTGDSIIFKLSGDYDLGNNNGNGYTFAGDGATASAAVGTDDNRVYVPALTGPLATDVNGLAAANIDVDVLDANDEVQLTANAGQSLVQDFVFYIYLRDIDVTEDANDDCVVTFDGPSGTGFATGTVTVGKVSSSGSLTLSVSGADTTNNNFSFDLRVKEDVLGSLDVDNTSIKLVLPDGFTWNDTAAVSTLWGQDIDAGGRTYDWAVNADGDELSLDFNGPKTTVASAWDFTNLTFSVSDESEVEAGDIVVKVKGESTSSPTTLTVGTYGNYGATISAKDTPTVYGGKVEQEVGDIVVKEEIGESLVAGRYITLTLPSYAKWSTVPDDGDVSDEGVTLNFDSVAGSDGNVIKYTIVNPLPGDDPAELKFEDLEVMLDVCAPGDLKVTLGGTSGVTGEVTIAKIASSVTATAEAKPEVKIGMNQQKIADITLTEAEAGAIEEGTLTLKVPAGCEFTGVPKVEVTSGDIGINYGTIARSKRFNVGAEVVQPSDYYQYLNIPIDNDSNDVSTIKISDIYVSVDRTVAEGDLKVAVLGNSVLQSNGAPVAGWFNDSIEANGKADINNDAVGDYLANASLFPNTAAITAVPAAVVTTPAPGATKANASFVIGSTTYKVAGVEMTMDVAPYVKDGRTFLPVRYVAQALGVADANILWDAASQKVTLIKDGTVVQLTIGSNVLLMNGAAITMDVAPELTSDRTMLPIRFIAQAFGATVGWDEATQTVTLN